MGDANRPPAVMPIGIQLELLRLSSAVLPTGSFAYSHGLETMVSRGRIVTEHDARSYLTSLVHVTLAVLDLPRLMRMHRAWSDSAYELVQRESAWLFAARESREAQEQDRQMAAAMLRICEQSFGRQRWRAKPRTFAEVFAFACVQYRIDEVACATGYAFAWAESHTTALARLIPLGPMAMQRLLCSTLKEVSEAVDHALVAGDADIAGATPGLAIAMAMHESQDCRVFRS